MQKNENISESYLRKIRAQGKAMAQYLVKVRVDRKPSLMVAVQNESPPPRLDHKAVFPTRPDRHRVGGCVAEQAVHQLVHDLFRCVPNVRNAKDKAAELGWQPRRTPGHSRNPYAGDVPRREHLEVAPAK